MSIELLDIEEKTQNQGVSSAGKLSALEFNNMKSKVNEIIGAVNDTVYLSQDEYDKLVASGNIDENVEYNVYEE